VLVVLYEIWWSSRPVVTHISVPDNLHTQ